MTVSLSKMGYKKNIFIFSIFKEDEHSEGRGAPSRQFEERSLIKDFLKNRKSQDSIAESSRSALLPKIVTNNLEGESPGKLSKEDKTKIDEKVRRNLERIEKNVAGTIRTLFDSSLLVLENHMFYLLEKSERTDYLNKLMESVEKV